MEKTVQYANCLREKGAYLKISEMSSILVQCSLKYRLVFLRN